MHNPHDLFGRVLLRIRLRDDAHQLGRIDRLYEVGVEAGLHDRDAVLRAAIPGERDEFDVVAPAFVADAPGDFIPIEAGEPDIDNCHVRA
jgi:hypothetical protein